ncbi:hypothetical protein Pmani_038543 [Petrolisthes manimaculis]|uniref:Uncharacterized protein n=1 Tax=Petrolisthes manimaculis TaxID=1843537 RepID=A0AAE1NE53_9EUCA|nr:hypothetical protein Pmani_038543 [Petrolisthes manimaculis]
MHLSSPPIFHPTSSPYHPTSTPSHPTSSPTHPISTPSHPTSSPTHPTSSSSHLMHLHPISPHLHPISPHLLLNSPHAPSPTETGDRGDKGRLEVRLREGEDVEPLLEDKTRSRRAEKEQQKGREGAGCFLSRCARRLLRAEPSKHTRYWSRRRTFSRQVTQGSADKFKSNMKRCEADEALAGGDAVGHSNFLVPSSSTTTTSPPPHVPKAPLLFISHPVSSTLTSIPNLITAQYCTPCKLYIPSHTLHLLISMHSQTSPTTPSPHPPPPPASKLFSLFSQSHSHFYRTFFPPNSLLQ